MRRARPLGLVMTLGLAGCGASASPGVTPAELRPAAPPTRYAVALRLEEAGEDHEGTPRTHVSLVRISPDGVRTVESLATEVGACWHEARPGTLTAARCWWAGFGAEYEVRREGPAVVARRAQADEERGVHAMVELARLEVPSDVELAVLGAR